MRIPDQLSRDAQFHMIQFIIDGLIRDTKLVRLRLIGSMHTGVDTQDDLAHKIYHRRKQHRARILHFGSAGKQRVDPLGIEQMLQHATGHHTDRSLFHKWFEHFPQCHRHPCPSITGSLLLARGTRLPKNSSTLEGLGLWPSPPCHRLIPYHGCQASGEAQAATVSCNRVDHTRQPA